MRQTRRKLGLAARFVNYGAIDCYAALDSRLRGNDEIYIPPPPNSGRRK